MAQGISGDTIDLEVLVDLEQHFYDAGYEDGLEHGKLHGRIEGRELGKQKGFEMWEELGFYEGFAKLWKVVTEQEEGEDSRASHSAKVLLDHVSRFPMENPSHTDSADVDIPKLFGQIRARYKMLCSTLGVKPSLRTSQFHTQASSSATKEDDFAPREPKKGNVWTVEGSQKSGSVDYSF